MKMNDLVPLEQYEWRKNRNRERNFTPTCYCGYDMEMAILMYQEILEALFLGKMGPKDDFNTKIGISYDKDILGKKLARIVYLAMEYDKPLLLKEAYCKLKDGDANLGDILDKLESIKYDDEERNAAAIAMKRHKQDMREVCLDAMRCISQELGNYATKKSFGKAIEVLFDKERREAFLYKKWDERYPDKELTTGDVEEMSEWILLDADMHDDLVWTKRRLDEVE